MTPRFDFVQRANADYIEEQYRRFRQDPASVGEDWALFFAGFELAQEPGRAPREGGPAGGAYGLVVAYREFGHLAARLDPLGQSPDHHPLLDLAPLGLGEDDLERPVEAEPFRGAPVGTLRELIDALRETYCGPLTLESMDIPDQTRRDWLHQRMESTRARAVLAPDERLAILRSLLMADAFEQFLHTRYVGQKRFSLEGGAALIPMLEVLVEGAADRGVEQLVLGMPHRGRLNVLANVLHKPLETIFSEFESSYLPEEIQGHGDVKYHMGYSSLHRARSGRSIHLDLNFNPSHLEFVNPVVLGSVRARQVYMRDLAGDRGIPVLIHGDAAMAGEGIVPETLALAQLPAHQTGGTVHLVVDNQVGFTTSPHDSRTGRYPTDVARLVEAPVLHVNGDEPEACVHAMAIALDYRATFKKDVFVHLVCYRRHGHNEMDDPTFTQPVMYRRIAAHVPASRAYARRLVAEGVLDDAALAAMEQAIADTLLAAHKRVRAEAPPHREVPLGGAWNGLDWAGEDWGAQTAVPRETLERIVQDVTRAPEGFHVHPKVAKLYAERVRMVAEDRIDWGCAEMLALGSLLAEGRNVRLTGQDAGRGTFSHRHAVLHDTEDGARHVPLQHLGEEQGRFDVVDSMLSEAAVLGFEYGYSTADPHTLTLWEAQFGDFANVAQVYIDQFLASAESKWRRMSGLTLLLPHGYEGQGPEHSSARLERFLELCAQGNLQVCNLTTPAQLFHALRRQLRRRFRKPLILMSPKSLLRHKLVVSPVSELSGGTFHPVIDDALAAPGEVRSVVLTSGKMHYTLREAREAQPRPDVALVRLEQLYPFPASELRAVFARYPQALDVRWVQEEPVNMGAWRHLRHRLEGVLPEGGTLLAIARGEASTPATGYYHMHIEQEKELIMKAFAPVESAPRPRAARRESSVPMAGGPGGAR
jgi:2-oxoglutarate dehydrogenase E1 component